MQKTILFKLFFGLVFLSLLSCSKQKNREVIEDVFYPLPAGAVKLDGFFEDYIQNSIEHWNKGDLPYDQFVDMSL